MNKLAFLALLFPVLAWSAPVATALGTADDAVLTAIGDLPTNAELATALGTADDAVLAALATTDGKVDDIKTKTDQLAFTVANQVDANAKSNNDAPIAGTGVVGDLWRGV